MEKELISFDEAAKELDVEPDDLKRMVSEGEIRAYRDSGDVCFRIDDLHALKEGMDTELSIGLASGEEEEEFVAEEPMSLHVEPSAEFAELTVADFEDEVTIEPREEQPQPAAAPESVLEDTVVNLDDTVTAEPDEEETFVLAEEDTVSDTLPLQLLDEEEDTQAGATEVMQVSEIQTPDMLGMPRLAVGHSPVMLALLILSTVILLYGMLIVVEMIANPHTPSPMTQWITRLGLF